jgi:hypothetical protein
MDGTRFDSSRECQFTDGNAMNIKEFSILHWCEINNCEIESAASLIMEDPSMVFNIQIEAEELHFLKKISRLPV